MKMVALVLRGSFFESSWDGTYPWKFGNATNISCNYIGGIKGSALQMIYLV